MIAFLTADANLPFSIAIAVVLILAVLEGVGQLMGAGLSEALENMLPDLELDVDAPDMASPSILGGVLSWLKIGQVPLLVSLIVFLTAFGLGGMVLQEIALILVGGLIPMVVAALGATLVALPTMAGITGILAKLMPRDETDAVSLDDLVGRIAVVTLGEATHDSPAQARVSDRHRQTHYVMVQPDEEGTVFEQGCEVLLVRRDGGFFQGIHNPSEGLSDRSQGQADLP
ncbi:YqiJ family protein [Magnetospira sp. QH-2]|uniref:YqiJ family protein n=1 Tax=Magnetospira sp. (strain QH-2) TaxID=1288970 RepID=UPI0003E81B20|nr:YqiJ family protein [Magnetospira sp. QH-2]CCQ74390.1 conserved membrane protein of unknown function [Magnetospira sp. QH-2]